MPAFLAGCDTSTLRSSPVPPARPGDLVVPASAQSQDLARYYESLQSGLLTRGLLRTDGGGPDTAFDADDLLRNFETIAFYDEYARSGSIGSRASGSAGRLNRWEGPVRIGIEFGATVPIERREKDRAAITGYTQRLARATGHSITATSSRPNFHVFVAGNDDAAQVQNRLRQLVPNITTQELALFANLPRSFYCFVIAVADKNNPNSYSRAVALIRAEHPDLVRLSCIHEELAQGLGLPNDSPSVRPSIFNDDDEFALLTTHDEALLRILYDPRLKPGMTAGEARPIVYTITREMMGEPL
ncbi:MAG: DUF2927 domain-containing protein [Paracoccaceae bacterium]